MYLNSRNTPPVLLHYRALSRRMALEAEDSRNMKIYENGFFGECLYDKLFDEVGHDNLYIFRDIYLETGKTGAQYDSIIIADDMITVNEIKNYSGEYYYKNGRFIKNNEVIPDNPFSQADRAVGKLYRICRDAKISADINSKVIFPNDDFKLYSEDDSIWKNIVIRMNLKKYFRQFKDSYNTEKAERLVSVIRSHISENPYFIGSSNIGRINKGLYCGKCGDFNLIKTRYHRQCPGCGTKESNETHMLRVMSDYKYLFYGKGMTRKSVLELIDNEFDKKVVYRAFLKYCEAHKKGNKTYYTFKYYDFDEAYKQTEKLRKHKDYLM